MRQREWLALLAMALLLAVAYVVLTLGPGYPLSALALAALGAVIVFYAFLPRIRRPKLQRWLHRTMTAVLIVVGLAAGVTEAMILHAAMDDEVPPCRYVLVLGAGVNGTEPSLALRERLQGALTYLQANPDTVCIVSGGQGSGESITEAACMSAWLQAHDIAPERILLEERATSTMENLHYTLALLDDQPGGRPSELAIVSSSYHLLRAEQMAASLGLEAYGIPARSMYPYSTANYYFREIFALWAFWLFGC